MHRPLILLSLLVLCPIVVHAQQSCVPGFDSPDRIVTAGGIGSAVYGDFNEDGRVDVAFVHSYRPVVALNRGGGVFEPPSATPPPLFLDDVLITTTDINGDGHLDLAFGRYGLARMLYGRGDGTFDPTIVVPELTGLRGFGGTLLDYDRDGIADIVETDRSDVYFARGRGDGTFESGIHVSMDNDTIVQVDRTAVGDFDGDGSIDAIRIAQHLPSFVWFVTIDWNATSTARSRSEFRITARIDGFAKEAIDVDGDGRQDILATIDGAVTALRFPDRQLTQRTIPFPGTLQSAPTHPAATDIDGDGHRDLLFVLGSALAIARGTANGAFEEAKLIGLVGAQSFDLADIDGDGTRDIVTTEGDDGLFVIRGGNTLFNTPSLQSVLPTQFGASGIQLADLDGDGRSDIVANDSQRMTVGVWLNRADGFRFTSNNRYGPSNVDGLGTRVFIADYDADGHLDLAVGPVEIGVQKPVVAFGNGDGAFTTSTADLTGSQLVGALRTSDLPGASLLVTRDGEVRALRVSRTGAVTSTSLFAWTSGAPVLAVDIDGDGFDEIAVGTSSTIDVKRRTGSTWETANSIAVWSASTLTKILARDVNGDLANDLLVVTDNRLSLLLRNGSGYNDATQIGSRGSFNDFGIGDLDRDGDPDLVFAVRRNFGQSGILQVSSNDGFGGFHTSASSLTGAPFGALAVDDVTGDGAADVLLTTFDGIEIQRNLECRTPRVRVAVEPSLVYSGQRAKLVIHALSGDSFAIGAVRIFQDAKLVATEQPHLAYDYATVVWTSEPLARGRHEFTIEYLDQFADPTSTTFTIDVVDKAKRRRAVR